jgi:hypothetical protein
MSYQQFKQDIKEKHLPDYYLLLLHYSSEIVEETLVRKHHLVAKDLKITPSKFSNILPLLVANRKTI